MTSSRALVSSILMSGRTQLTCSSTGIGPRAGESDVDLLHDVPMTHGDTGAQ